MAHGLFSLTFYQFFILSAIHLSRQHLLSTYELQSTSLKHLTTVTLGKSFSLCRLSCALQESFGGLTGRICN